MKYLTTFLLVAFLAGFTFAEPGYEIKVVSQTENEIKFEANVTEYKTVKVQVEGKEYLVVSIPEAGMYMKRGYPQVPKLAKLVKISDIYEPELVVISQVEEEAALEAPILPSKGHFTRDIDPSTVPYECGDVYKKDAFWPCEKHQLSIAQPFIFRDLRGVRVEFLPISANHVQMKMKVIKKIEFAIKLNKISRTNVITRTRGETIDTNFSNIYEGTFINYKTSKAEIPTPNKNVIAVVPSSLDGAAVSSWITHKAGLGWKVTKITSGDLDAFDADTIKARLQKLYDDVNTRFAYVVLFGDASSNSKTATPTPTFQGKKEGAATDRIYVRLAGNDNYPDAFISRITGKAEKDIQIQVDKIIAYENQASESYHQSALCIASNQGSPTDFARANWLIDGGHESQKYSIPKGQGLAGQGYSNIKTQYDPSATASGVANAVNEGVGVICYIGHGSTTSWGSTGFSNSNIASLTNGGRYPVIWSVACVNGKFTGYDCFAEAWLLKEGAGAVAIEAASTNESWVPPCDKQAATLFFMIRSGGDKSFGYLECAGCIEGGLKQNGDTDSSEGNKMAEQCNLFGDCTMIVKTAK